MASDYSGPFRRADDFPHDGAAPVNRYATVNDLTDVESRLMFHLDLMRRSAWFHTTTTIGIVTAIAIALPFIDDRILR